MTTFPRPIAASYDTDSRGTLEPVAILGVQSEPGTDDSTWILAVRATGEMLWARAEDFRIVDPELLRLIRTASFESSVAAVRRLEEGT